MGILPSIHEVMFEIEFACNFGLQVLGEKFVFLAGEKNGTSEGHTIARVALADHF